MNTDPAPPAPQRFSQAVIDALPMSFIVLALDGSITAVNQAWIAFVNEKVPAMVSVGVGVNYLEANTGGNSTLYGGFSSVARDGIEAVLRGANKHFSMEFPIQTDAGRSWYLLHTVSIGNSEAEAAIVSHFDITSYKREESNQLETAEQFLELSNHLRQVLWISDAVENRILYLSPAFEEVWGRTCKSIYEDMSLFLSSIHPEDRERMAPTFANQVDTGGFDAEYRILKPDGTMRWISARCYAVRDKSNTIPRFVGIAEDVTERKELEQRFLQSQRMEIVSHLASGVAHDFNNLIAVIGGYTDLIGQEMGSGSPLQSYVEEIRSAVKHAGNLTQQLLVFSRKQMVKVGVLDLNTAIAGMEEMLRRLIFENVELTFVYGDKAGPVQIDSGSLWQLLMNLVVNARDAMENGGKLNIETSSVNLGGVYLRTHPAVVSGRYAVLRVTDTGIGMTEAIKSRLFEAFFTTKSVGKGIGLGLATCESIIRKSGGHIDVVTAPNMGTTFNIYFPLVDLTPVSKPEHPMPLQKEISVKGGTETLLLVEDDASLRKLVARILKAHGYVVISASNGREALRIAEEHKGEQISLIVTDVVMPQMGGVVMAEWLQTTHPDVKVLFTSGYTEDAMTQQGILEGGLEFLPKPYTSEALLAKVREVLDKEYAV